MGFRSLSDESMKTTLIERQEMLQHVEPEDLLSFGFIPEFVGRLPMVTVLAELTEGQLVSILTETKSALRRQYAKLLAMEGVELAFSDDSLAELARQAIRKGIGARALRSLLEKLMLDAYFALKMLSRMTSLLFQSKAMVMANGTSTSTSRNQ